MKSEVGSTHQRVSPSLSTHQRMDHDDLRAQSMVNACKFQAPEDAGRRTPDAGQGALFASFVTPCPPDLASSRDVPRRESGFPSVKSLSV